MLPAPRPRLARALTTRVGPVLPSFQVTFFVGLALVPALGACREDGARGAGSASANVAAGPSVAAPPPSGLPPASPSAPSTPSEAAADDELSTRPMELLRFRFTSGVEGREPKDELDHAVPGKRVYAYLAIRNRTGKPRTITLSWKVNGESRTVTELPIDESWQFRTWAYNTLLAKDTKGTVELEVVDDSGHPVVEKKIPIRP